MENSSIARVIHSIEHLFNVQPTKRNCLILTNGREKICYTCVKCKETHNYTNRGIVIKDNPCEKIKYTD